MLGLVKIRVNGAVAAILISFMVIVAGVWLTLVLTHNIDAKESLKWIATTLAGFLAGSATPLVSYWREKKISFDIGGDTPMPPPSTRKATDDPRSG